MVAASSRRSFKSVYLALGGALLVMAIIGLMVAATLAVARRNAETALFAAGYTQPHTEVRYDLFRCYGTKHRQEVAFTATMAAHEVSGYVCVSPNFIDGLSFPVIHAGDR